MYFVNAKIFCPFRDNMFCVAETQTIDKHTWVLGQSKDKIEFKLMGKFLGKLKNNLNKIASKCKEYDTFGIGKYDIRH